MKAPLNRDAVVSAALNLLAHDGVDGMSLRKVAAALETGPASLYAYIEDLRELQTLVLDQALANVVIPKAGLASWRSRLEAILTSFVNVLAASPGLADLALNTIAAGPNALRILEALLALLDEAGVDGKTAAWAIDLITLYATAVASEQSHRRDSENPLGSIAKMIDAVAERDFPRIHAVRERLLSGEGTTRFAWAVDVLLKGILETPVSEGARDE